ncbi:MAG: aminotransferase class I/II-fold pyridoxal phosphate-dependent enzyme [Candidatus Aminicenantes bacterium]|nr:MAG: aminotransferase class I/II-fold pyridoxal phosphate-dependent enzyme [Candidatus Aminicenantes bacterium]
MNRYRFLEPSCPDLSIFTGYIKGIVSGGRLSNNGPMVKKLEASFKNLFEVEQAICVSSATLGLLILLRVLDITPGSEVILPSFNFPAPAEAALWNRLELSYGEIRGDDLTMDVSQLNKCLNHRSRVIMPVHSMGNLADVDAWHFFAKKHDLCLLFDGASAIGSLILPGKGKAGIGIGTVISLHATKILPAGEGGVILTNDRSLSKLCRQLINFGFDTKGSVNFYGLNAKLSELHAAFVLAGLKNLHDNLNLRVELMEVYLENLGRIPWLIPCVSSPSVPHLFPVLLNHRYPASLRESLLNQLHLQGIETRCYYNPPLHRMPAFKPALPISLPITEEVCSRIICLPFHTGLSPGSVIDMINRMETIEVSYAQKS